MPSRRALLYMPGDDWKKITKSITLGVDCICMDMEDAVAVSRKAEARDGRPGFAGTGFWQKRKTGAHQLRWFGLGNG